MASNIATGIGLSGQLQADNSGQLNRLAAEKAAAGERQAKQAAEAKERDDLEKEVRKNLLVNSNLKTDFYQKDFSDRASSTMTDIIRGLGTGEMSKAEIYGKLQSFRNYTDRVRIEDQGLYTGLSEVAKDPNAYDAVGRHNIGGKTYTTLGQALNDPFVRTTEGFKQLQEQFPRSEYNFIQSSPEEMEKGAPAYTVGYSPIQAMSEQDIINEIQKVDEAFTSISTDPSQATRIAGTNNVRQPFHRSIDQAAIGPMVQDYMTQEPAMRGYERMYKNQFLKDNPDKTVADWYKTDEAQNFLENAGQRLEGVIGGLKKTEWGSGTIPRPPAAKEAKPSLHAKKYNVSPMSVVDYGNHTANRVTFNPVSSPGKATMRIPNNAVMFLSDGTKDEAPKTGFNSEINPVGVEWKNGELYFLANITDNKKDVTISIPKSQEAFEAMAAGLYLNTPEERAELVNYIKEAVGADPKAAEKDFYKSLGVTDEQLKMVAGFGASPTKAGTQKMDAQGKVYEEEEFDPLDY